VGDFKGIACVSAGNLLAEMTHGLLVDLGREERWDRRTVIGHRLHCVLFRPLPHKDYNRLQVPFPCSLKEGRGRS